MTEEIKKVVKDDFTRFISHEAMRAGIKQDEVTEIVSGEVSNCGWHQTKDGDYPQLLDEYKDKNYPQIPCLVIYHGSPCILYWNCTEDCWDDEKADDYYCEKDAVERWRYIDELL